jgi:aspartyl-tRNA(Asn)/glutamyl-tRNA(Gln) amidotransferase subunit A
MPIAIKDRVEIEGESAMGGTAAWRQRRALQTATLMRKLMAAGIINLGKAHAVEFACGGWAPTSIPAHPESLGTPLRILHQAAPPRVLASPLPHGWTLGHRHRYWRVGADPSGMEWYHWVTH